MGSIVHGIATPVHTPYVPSTVSPGASGSITALLAAAWTVIGIIEVEATGLRVDITNGNLALDRFLVESSTDGVSYSEEARTWSDFVSLAGILTGSSGEIVTIPADGTGYIEMNTTGKSHIRLSASVTEGVQTTGIVCAYLES